jgi:hypothetical protein
VRRCDLDISHTSEFPRFPLTPSFGAGDSSLKRVSLIHRVSGRLPEDKGGPTWRTLLKLSLTKSANGLSLLLRVPGSFGISTTTTQQAFLPSLRLPGSTPGGQF